MKEQRDWEIDGNEFYNEIGTIFLNWYILTLNNRLCVLASITQLAGIYIVICRGRGSNPRHPTYSP
jgi:hypothetical protein